MSHLRPVLEIKVSLPPHNLLAPALCSSLTILILACYCLYSLPVPMLAWYVPIHIGLRSWSVMQNSPPVAIDFLYAHSAADPRILGEWRPALVYGVCFLPRVRCNIVLPVGCGIHLLI
jgi:hypothetical protein